MNIIFLGIDQARNEFQLCGLNQAGMPVFTKRTTRDQLFRTIASIPACKIGMEASSEAYYLQQEIEKQGHKVHIISHRYVRPYIRWKNKAGWNAQAIASALMAPATQYSPHLSAEQLDIEALLKARNRLSSHRAATVTQITELLIERGICLGTSSSSAIQTLPLILEGAGNRLTLRLRKTISELYELFNDIERHINILDNEIEKVFRKRKV